VTHIAALPGVIPAMEDMIGNTIERLLVDAGYRGHNAPTDYKFRIYTSGQKRNRGLLSLGFLPNLIPQPSRAACLYWCATGLGDVHDKIRP
jgi:hypothetical protein